MFNPIRLFTGTEKEFVMIQGYVRSVTDRGSYNSVSFLADSNNRDPKAPLVSAMCFDNTTGINYKKLTRYTKGRFVTFFAEVRYKDDGTPTYKAIGISIAPTEFKEDTNPIDDSEVQNDYDETEEYEQLTFDFDDEDLPFPATD